LIVVVAITAEEKVASTPIIVSAEVHELAAVVNVAKVCAAGPLYVGIDGNNI
jgi:hypothetical protein